MFSEKASQLLLVTTSLLNSRLISASIGTVSPNPGVMRTKLIAGVALSVAQKSQLSATPSIRPAAIPTQKCADLPEVRNNQKTLSAPFRTALIA